MIFSFVFYLFKFCSCFMLLFPTRSDTPYMYTYRELKNGRKKYFFFAQSSTFTASLILSSSFSLFSFLLASAVLLGCCYIFQPMDSVKLCGCVRMMYKFFSSQTLTYIAIDRSIGSFSLIFFQFASIFLFFDLFFAFDFYLYFRFS